MVIGYYGTVIQNLKLEVETSDQNGQNSNEAVISTTSEAFAGWLHHSSPSVILLLVGEYCFAVRYLVLFGSE